MILDFMHVILMHTPSHVHTHPHAHTLTHVDTIQNCCVTAHVPLNVVFYSKYTLYDVSVCVYLHQGQLVCVRCV